MGKILIFFGIGLILIGIYISFGGNFHFLGHLPGDIYFTQGNTSFYFPIVTCALVSIVVSVVWNLFFRR